MRRPWGLLCLFLLADRVSSIGLRLRSKNGHRHLGDDSDDDLKASIIEEAISFLEENMSIDTLTPTRAPIEPTPGPSLSPSESPVSPAPSMGVDPTPAPIDTPAPVPPSQAPTSIQPVPTVPPTSSPTAPPIPTVAPTTAPSPAPTPAPQPPTPPPTAVTPAPTSTPTVVMPAPTQTPPTSTPTTLPTGTPSSSPSSTPSEVASAEPTATCNLPPEERAMVIMDILETISPGGSLETPGSPQNLAANWLINEDMKYVCPQDPALVQRYSMAVFYYSTDGDDWFQCTAPSDFESEEAIAEANANCNITAMGGTGSDAWLTPSCECDWGGTACGVSGFVERIDFERNGIGGFLPSEISRLVELRYLLLEEGLISGTIPSDIGFNKNLIQLDLNFNVLNGPLPESIYQLTNLEQLDLNDNEFSGTISTSISQLRQLVFLQLEQNDFAGTIPESLGNLFLLEVATLDNNNLSGTMPSLVCANRTGLLQVLTADCLGAPTRPSPPYVQCDCCTQCF